MSILPSLCRSLHSGHLYPASEGKKKTDKGSGLVEVAILFAYDSLEAVLASSSYAYWMIVIVWSLTEYRSMNSCICKCLFGFELAEATLVMGSVFLYDDTEQSLALYSL